MKLSVKLSLAMGLLTVIIILSNIFSIWQLSRVNSTSTRLAQESIPALVAAEELNTLFADYRVLELQHVYSEDAAAMKRYEDALAENSNEFYALLTQLEKFPMDQATRKLYADYQKVSAEYDKVHEEMFAFSRANQTERAIEILNGKQNQLYVQAGDLLERIVQSKRADADTVNAEGDAIYGTSFFSLICILIGAVIIAVAVAFVIVRGTLKLLGKDPGELAHLAERVTGGDYDIDDGSPKIGVYGNLVAMVAALKENIAKAVAQSERAAEESRNARTAMEKAEAAGREARAKTESLLKAADRLEEVAVVVSSASSELSAQIEQSERGSSEQAARVAETATAMEEMNSTVLEVAKNAGAASDVSAATRHKAEAGADVVQKAVSGIRDVREQSLRLKEDMTVLDENARAISRIMAVISDIADQTNLLALNAAIEAARAGDAGRGFAVVADEVRNLAEKTMTSTTDVGNAIKAIQDSAAKSMGQVDSAVQTIEAATDYANQSGEALQEIVSMVDNTADQVRAIAAASEQQSASSEEINQSITQVNTIAGETARAMEEAARAVTDLAGQAQVLTGLIEDLKRS